uniref:SOUL heme-binding protein n=1 Tax=Chromera velia CCMP2878 TaxID=1169474 RepID=A0A0G4FZS4_9ALVE|eukprot:Cvel_19405.t1-p1 / transcript=Cvel_19405.t1 / gene=Cvel_19405 / organism=Chromera_velia_CCMP2878 / gene_product=Heme-binding-like protein At3g10130, chloroplastic, putative / transcript_product=Heme-binding-like protein At3g10130, chloroplastic, putative / location=Cvel_scaffold1670:29203-30579(+) / protein_length=459 / sequence_SO=supercontig / SO=protein_coding / is_pseudo=false
MISLLKSLLFCLVGLVGLDVCQAAAIKGSGRGSPQDLLRLLISPKTSKRQKKLAADRLAGLIKEDSHIFDRIQTEMIEPVVALTENDSKSLPKAQMLSRLRQTEPMLSRLAAWADPEYEYYLQRVAFRSLMKDIVFPEIEENVDVEVASRELETREVGDDVMKALQIDALILVLRELAASKSARKLLKKAAAGMLETDPKSIRKRRPKNLETPRYRVLKRFKSGAELREYYQYTIVETEMKERPFGRAPSIPSRRRKLPRSSFFRLKKFLLDGDNQQRLRMKMTVPVVKEIPVSASFAVLSPQAADEDDDVPAAPAGSWTAMFQRYMGGYAEVKDIYRGDGEGEGPVGVRKMAFVLPSRFWGKDRARKAPLPDDEAVLIREIPRRKLVVRSVPGYLSEAKVRKEARKLRKEVEAQSGLELADAGRTLFLLEYTDPFVTPWKAGGEIAFEVVAKSAEKDS